MKRFASFIGCGLVAALSMLCAGGLAAQPIAKAATEISVVSMILGFLFLAAAIAVNFMWLWIRRIVREEDALRGAYPFNDIVSFKRLIETEASPSKKKRYRALFRWWRVSMAALMIFGILFFALGGRGSPVP